jgi:hypothetical protein
MAIILKANKVNLFISSVLFVFWYNSPNFLDTPHIQPLTQDAKELAMTTGLSQTEKHEEYLQCGYSDVVFCV